MVHKHIYIKMPVLYDFGGDISKKWYIYYYVRSPITNKLERFMVQENMNQCTSKKERKAYATKLLAKYKRKLKNGWTPFNDKDTIYASILNYADKGKKHKPEIKEKDYSIEQFVSKALESIKKDLRDKTFKSYQSQLRGFVKWLRSENLEHLEIIEFDVKQAQKFLDSLTLHKRTIKAYRNNLKRIFNIDIIKEVLEVNPFAETKPIKSETTENKRAFRSNEIALIKEYCLDKEPEMWFFIQFIFYCFIRPNELRQLKVGDFNFDNNLIEIRHDIAKNKKSQRVTMPNHFAKEVFEKLKDKQSKDYVFPSLQRIKRVLDPPRPRSKSYFTNKFRAILETLGFDYKEAKVSLYSWKHTGVINFYKAEKDLSLLQSQLRHSSLEMTEIYLRSHINLNDDALRNNFPEL